MYQELGLLSGLLVKHTLQPAHPSADVLAAQVSKVDALLAELHDAYKAPMINSFQSVTTTAPTPPGQPSGTSVLYGMGDFFAKAIFYAGAGAYDFQYLALAAKRYEGDAEWIVQHGVESGRGRNPTLRVCPMPFDDVGDSIFADAEVAGDPTIALPADDGMKHLRGEPV